jgi:hypothetical protein
MIIMHQPGCCLQPAVVDFAGARISISIHSSSSVYSLLLQE